MSEISWSKWKASILTFAFYITCYHSNRVLSKFQTKIFIWSVFWKGIITDLLISTAAKHVLITRRAKETAGISSSAWHLVDELKFTVKLFFN